MIMKKVSFILLLICTSFSNPVGAQWKLLHDFPARPPASAYNVTDIGSIYFLDLPGPPKIGFLGIASTDASDTRAYEGGEVWKTTDGGATWRQIGPTNDRSVYGNSVEGFAFKDSLNGWLVADGQYGGCFRTTDCGETWSKLPGTDYPCSSITFHKATQSLILLLENIDLSALTSTDEGKTWETLNGAYTGCAFTDDSTGLLTGGSNGFQNYTSNSVTTDGGKSWNAVAQENGCYHPVAIANTKTFFLLDSNADVWRSDNGGNKFTKIYHFPIPSTTTIFGLYGDLREMYTQTLGGGVFRSTDEGLSWVSLCGPRNHAPYIARRAAFYQRGAIIYAADLPTYGDAKLWINETGKATGPRLSFTSEKNQLRITAIAGDSTSIFIRAPHNLVSGFAADSISFTLTFDSDVVSHLTDLSSPGWTIETTLSLPSLIKFKLRRSPGTSLVPDSTIAILHFRTNLALRDTAAFALNEVDWDADYSYFACVQPQLTASDTIHLVVTRSCGDSIILAKLKGKLPYEVLSVEPNPSTSYVNIHVKNELGLSLRYQLFDELGRVVEAGITEEPTLRLNLSSHSTGNYFLRLSGPGGAPITQKLSIER
jgi:hypothetical protein